MSIKHNSLIFNEGLGLIETYHLIGKSCNAFTIVFGDFVGDSKKDIACVDEDHRFIRIFENLIYRYREHSKIPIGETLCNNINICNQYPMHIHSAFTGRFISNNSNPQMMFVTSKIESKGGTSQATLPASE